MDSEIMLENGEAVAFPEMARYCAPRPAGERVELIVLHHTAGHADIDLPDLTRAHGATGILALLHHPRRSDSATGAPGGRRVACRPVLLAGTALGQSLFHRHRNGKPRRRALAAGSIPRLRRPLPRPACRFGLAPEDIVSHAEIACWIEDDLLIWEKDGARRKNDPANFPWDTFRALIAERGSLTQRQQRRIPLKR